jgi:hypothetical protein
MYKKNLDNVSKKKAVNHADVPFVQNGALGVV